MAVPIAELFVSVGADVSQAISGLTNLGNQLDNTAARFQAAAPAALLLEAGAAAVGAGLFEATKVAASFEQAMADVRAVMTPTEAQQFGSALGDLAVQLGQQTVFSAREAAAGIGELIRAGIPAESVLGGAAAAALNLASATGISVASAATTAAQTMNAFHKSAADLTGVVDTLAGTANATAATMSDLQFGLQVVSATANTMGLSFQDTTAAIGIFVNAGITGATAGTGLRQMLLELIPTTKPAREEMLKLGITTKDGGNAFFDAAGHVRTLAGISQVLQIALRGMSDEQRIAALNTLFTRDAINSATILAQQGAAGVNALTAEIAKISAADTAAIRLGTLQGAMNNLGSSVETVQIIVGNVFLPTITSIANTLRGAVDSFSSLDPALQRAVVLFSGVGAAVAGLVGSVVLLAPFIIAVGPAFVALGGALIAIAPLILGLAAAGAVLTAAWQSDLGGIQGIVSDAFSHLPELLDNVSQAFTTAGAFWVESIVPGVRTIGEALATRLGPTVAQVADTWNTRMVPAFQNIGDRLGPRVVTLMDALTRLWEIRLLPALESIGGFIVDTLVPGFVDLIANGLEQVIPLSDRLAQLWQTQLAPAFEFVAGIVGSTLGGAFNAALPFVQNFASFVATTLAPALLDFASNIVPALQGAAAALAGFWTSTLQPAFDATGTFISSSLVPFFVDLATKISEIAGAVGPTVVDFFQNQLPAALAAVGAQAVSLGPFLEALTGFFGALFNVITALTTLGGTALQGLFENVLVPGFQSLGNVIDPVRPAMQGMADALTPLATGLGLIGERIQPLTDFFTNATGSLNVFADAVRNFQLPDWLQPKGGAPGTPGVPSLLPASFTPGGGFAGVAGGGGGPAVQIGQLIISSEAEAEAFIQRMAVAVRASAGRVNVPPDNSGVPALSTGVI